MVKDRNHLISFPPSWPHISIISSVRHYTDSTDFSEEIEN